MTLKPYCLAALMVLALSSCGAGRLNSGDGFPSTLVKLDSRAPIQSVVTDEARYFISSVSVTVPETLQVSEANQIHPDADIVWRGDPPGDRLVQVKAIVDDGLSLGIRGLKTGPKTKLSVQLERFHALTEKARFLVGGVHDIVFVMTVRDAVTGAVLEGPRRVEVAIRASGGDAAIAQDAAGRTQKVVIIEGLAEAIQRELSGTLVLNDPRKQVFFGLFR